MSGDSVEVHFDQREPVTQQTELPSWGTISKFKQRNQCLLHIIRDLGSVVFIEAESEVTEIKQKRIIFTLCHIIAPVLGLRAWRKSPGRLMTESLWCEPSGAHCHAAGLRNMPAGWRQWRECPMPARMWGRDAWCQRACERPSCDWRNQQLIVTPAAYSAL